MKRITLLLAVIIAFVSFSNAQKSKKSTQITGYAITAAEKGQSSWKEVRLIDLTSGEEIQSIYRSNNESQPLNARTGKPVAKKDIGQSTMALKKVVNLDMELDKKERTPGTVQVFKRGEQNGLQPTTVDVKHVETIRKDGKTIVFVNGDAQRVMHMQTDKPFATNSAAMAFDKKHNRLYYTPMGINQLRFIDLKSNQIYYFEDEAFGVVTGMGDAPNQITRMVIASDGNGYALSNNADHLIRFTLAKKAESTEITDLGPLTDDAANAKYSVHSRGGYGGDMVADAQGNLYLITANRNVFRIAIDSKVATYIGTINGLPQGFSTNGAMVEEGSKVIVASSQSTVGYYRFDLTTMQAEKVSSQETVFNASDLANSVLAFDKKKKKKQKDEETVKEEPKQPEEVVAKQTPVQQAATENNNILVYPNPVTNGYVKVSFADQPAGRYQLQLMDIAGKLISSQDVVINNKIQVEEFRLPEFITKGNYLLKVVSENNKVSVVNKLTVQ
jgi:hypothetical protein